MVTPAIITKDTPESAVLKAGEPCGAFCGWDAHCCKHASGILIQGEKASIAKSMGIPEQDFERKYLEDIDRYNKKLKQFKQLRKKSMPHGPCIMLGKDNRCKIQGSKPLYCKVGNCRVSQGTALMEWFALNHFVDPHDAESMRQWAQHVKHNGTIPGGDLHELVPDKERLSRMLNHEILY